MSKNRNFQKVVDGVKTQSSYIPTLFIHPKRLETIIIKDSIYISFHL